MLPPCRYSVERPLPLNGFVATSHHVSLSDVLNGYCLCFYSVPKEFSS